MGWTERQRLMLQEMGLRVWSPAAQPAAATDAASTGIVAVQTLPAIVAADAGRPALDLGVAETSTRASSDRARASAVLAPAADSDAAPARAPDDRARRIATLQWPALREAVATCTACTLCQGRRQTVFGVGHVNAHWMIVGEAPGEQEDLKGEPFVGAAGQLLDNMLRALNLTRAEAPPGRQVYIANTLKCRPPRNRNPEPEELAQCEPFLMRQIELIRPQLILAMGRFAVHALLRTTDPIGKLRGRVHRYQGVPLVVTYHPAYLLRNLADKARAWDDLCLAAQTVDSAGAAVLTP